MAPRGLAKAALSALLYAFDSILLAFLVARNAIVRRTPPTGSAPVALIVRTDRIGDFLLWLPSARRLAEHLCGQGYRVVIIVNQESATLSGGLIGGTLTGRVEVWPLDLTAFWIRPGYRARLLSQVAGLGADWAIQPMFSRLLASGDAIVRLSGARRRSAWIGDLANTTRLGHWLGSRVYTELLDNPPPGLHDSQINEYLLEKLGVPLDRLHDVPLPCLRPASLAGQPPLPERYVVLAPGASQALRRWPAARFAQLADRLHADHGLSAILCGGTADQALAAAIGRQSAAPLLDLTGRVPLRELPTLVAGATLLIGNDSAAVHLAALLGVPSVCIAGGGHPGRFIPYAASRLWPASSPPEVARVPMPCYGCRWICIHRPGKTSCGPCIDAVTVDAAYAQVRRALALGSGSRCEASGRE